ncbi:MAG: hypothetical protein HYZ27_06860 [Deltaproteobacteria bacterium]|nr:hypothetical protein [Deltaproteobacteria bacterium]
MAILPELQAAIEALHDVRTDVDVCTFLVDDQTRAAIPGGRAGLPEQLFVQEDQDGVALGLYIDPGVLSRLERDHPERRLHDGNLESYCIALEGISHFVFLIWRASIGRPVTRLELEIQAEADKSVSAWLLLDRQGQPRHQTAEPLLDRLFEAYELREEVAHDEVDRYHTATRVALRYCRGLTRRFARDSDTSRVEQSAREFFRQGLAEKLRAA